MSLSGNYIHLFFIDCSFINLSECSLNLASRQALHTFELMMEHVRKHGRPDKALI